MAENFDPAAMMRMMAKLQRQLNEEREENRRNRALPLAPPPSLLDYMYQSQVGQFHGGRWGPTLQANTFELKPGLIEEMTPNSYQLPHDRNFTRMIAAFNEPKKVSLEEMMQQMLAKMSGMENDLANFETTMSNMIANVDTIASDLTKRIKTINTQMVQIAAAQHEPGHAEVMQKRQCNEIFDDTVTSRYEEVEKIAVDETHTPKKDYSIPHISAAIELVSILAHPKSEYKLAAPFPCCLAKPNTDEKMVKFMEISLKRNDPDSFIIVCVIGGLTFSEVLWDLKVSIILMPLFAFYRVGIG